MARQRIELGELPWATLTVVALCLVVSLLYRPPAASVEPGGAAGLAPAIAYFERHAYLEPPPEIVLALTGDASPAERRAVIARLRDESYRRWPSEQSVRDAQQAELDRLFEQSLAEATRVPAAPWSFVPAAVSLRGLASYAFCEPRPGPLAAQLLGLLLLGAALERRWRAPALLLFSAVAVLFAAGFYLAMVPDATRGLRGPAALLAAWSAAAWATFRHDGWRLELAGVALPANGSLPAWSLAAAGLAAAGLGGAAQGAGGFAYQGAVGGLLFGAFASLLLGEERGPRPSRPQRAAASARDERPPLERAREAQASGDTARAFALLQGAVRASPRDRELVLAFWDVAIACSRTDAACPPLLALIREMVEQDELPLAARYWMQVTRIMPGARLDAPALIGLAPTLAKVGQKDAALDALRKSVAARARGLTGRLALRVSELAEELGDSALVVEAGRQALDKPDLSGRERAALQQKMSDATVRAEQAQGLNLPTPPQDEPEEDESQAEGSAAVARFPAIKVIEGVPELLCEGALKVRISDERTIDVEYGRVQAVAAAGVMGVGDGDGPVVLIDLAMNWNEAEGAPLNVVRLRGDRFDPRGLIGDGVRIAEAYRVLLRELFNATGAVPLPDEKIASGGSMRVFESLESYQRKVLDVGGE